MIFRVESSIISIDRNITVLQENYRSKKGPLRNSSINWVFLWLLSIQNHLKPPITEKKNKAKYLIWNSVRCKFVKKTSMSNSVESLGYMMCYSLSNSRPVKNPCNSIRNKSQKISSWSRRPKTMLNRRKKASFLEVVINHIYNFFKDVTNYRKKTKMVIVFSIRPFPNILKYGDHQWDLLTI